LKNRSSYSWTGLSLLTAGLFISITSYFVFQLTWLTGLGLCMLLLAVILVALGRAVPKLPPEACRLLLDAGNANITSLIEELGIITKAIFLPSSMTSDYPRAFLPLQHNCSLPSTMKVLPRRLFVRYGSNPDDIGLLIPTIGSTAIRLLEKMPGANSDELEAALTSLFTEILGISDRARVSCENSTIGIEIDKPRIEDDSRLHRCLGGKLATISASVAAEAWNKPICIKREDKKEGKYYIELEIGK
jgi:hypothetical protein